MTTTQQRTRSLLADFETEIQRELEQWREKYTEYHPERWAAIVQIELGQMAESIVAENWEEAQHDNARLMAALYMLWSAVQSRIEFADYVEKIIPKKGPSA